MIKELLVILLLSQSKLRKHVQNKFAQVSWTIAITLKYLATELSSMLISYIETYVTN